MRKSHIRDYATAAFQYYALTGGLDRFRAKLWAIIEVDFRRRGEESGDISKPTESALIHFEKELEKKQSEVLDLEAVEKTKQILERMRDGNDIIRVLKSVYMVEPQRDPERGEISERVHKAEIAIPASEKTIYRWLALARKTFAEARGLRM